MNKMASNVKGDLSDLEKKLLDSVVKGNIEEVRELLKETSVRIDALDDTGMTVLQQAAFRGKKDICELLLSHGADVNSNYHDNEYTALMFACLSGNPEVTRLMLEAGAKIDHTNSVGRTAAQMGAFVGQHHCVSVINNFFPKESLNHYTKPQGFEKEAKLPIELAPSMVKLLNLSSLHPVKISLFLQEHIGLVEKSKGIIRVLENLCEKAMKDRDTNDVLAMKTHYLAVLIKAAAKSYDEKKNLDTWLKLLVRGREGDGFPEYQEKLIRQMLREFPYSDSQLFQQMVRNLSTVKIGNEPTALTILKQGIQGQKFGWEEEECCDTCGEPKAEKKCSACKMYQEYLEKKKKEEILRKEQEENEKKEEILKKEQEENEKKLEETNIKNK
ncbi:hypothetical protein KUTeg_014908, partial [Tegillarca granosa]